MKILFTLLEPTPVERTGVMCLSASLKKNGHKVISQISDRPKLKRLGKIIREYQPDIIAYSAMTGEYIDFLNLNRRLKSQFDFLAVFGGPHPTFFPGVIENEGVDAVCVGEGDLAFPLFCDRYENQGAYWRTPNFLVKYNNEIYRNELMPLVEDLDSLPFPDREVLSTTDFALLQNNFSLFFSSRGCPYHCSYCFNHAYNNLYKGKGNVLRYRSPESIIEEIYQVTQKFSSKIVYMNDDTFLAKPDGWIDKFCELYQQEIGLPFWCHVRANLVNDYVMRRLSNAGLSSVWMGIECGDEKVSNKILKRGLSNEQIMTAARIIQKYNIKLITQNINGLPVKDSYLNDLKTLDFNIQINPSFAISSLLYPYTGTQIESYARHNGFLTSRSETHKETTKKSSLFIFSSELEKRKIENLHKLFGIIVRFPILRKYVDCLCAMPLKVFYSLFYYFLLGYNFKYDISPPNLFGKDLKKNIGLFLRFVRKT